MPPAPQDQAAAKAERPASRQAAVLLSFDAEEFDIPGEFGRALTPGQQLETGATGLRRVLDLLDRAGVRATFFTTARLAQAAPDSIRRLVRAGHELASHGVNHAEPVADDLRRSREILSTLGGVPVRGFRRARFGPVDAAAARAAGYLYDSSEHPVWLPGRYNGWRIPRRPRMEAGLLRLPVSATPLLRLPLFWLAFKNYPFALYRALCRWTLRQDGLLALVFHPWEFCELDGFGLPRYVRRVDGTALERRLETLIASLQPMADFTTYGAWAEEYLGNVQRSTSNIQHPMQPPEPNT